MLDDNEMLERLKSKTVSKGNNEKAVTEKARIEKRLSALSKLMKTLYEDYVAGVLDGNNYMSFLSDYQREQQGLNGKLAVIGKELAKGNEKEKGFEQLKATCDEFRSCKELTAEMINKLIERIEVSHNYLDNGKLKQNINIIYRLW